tara:strand:- start:25 stop:243 length:219 start_codon:yes stop_codon:yes gene_type:complete
MTQSQKRKLDKALDNFKSFFEFHDFAFKNDIEFDNDEWIEYSNKLKRKILTKKEPTHVYINTTGLILPKNRK